MRVAPLVGLALLGLGCSLVAEFPADCDPSRCDGGLSCDGDGVQCRFVCGVDDHCRAGFACDAARGVCEPTSGGGSGEGEGEGEPTCPQGERWSEGRCRPGEGEGEGEGPGGPGDLDGDGVADAEDTCPEVPDPRNGDGDLDGVGDVCDVCPIDPNPDQSDFDGDGEGDLCDNCVDVPNADSAGRADPDRDGVGAACDNCPDATNRDQADRDSDGIGDACDACPDFANAQLGEEDCESLDEPPEPNGHVGAALRVEAPAVVEGAIDPEGADVYSGLADADVYVLRARQGRIVRAQAVATGGLLDPVLTLKPLWRDSPALVVGADGGQAVAEWVADRTEDWEVTVADADGGGGRDGYGYVLLLESRSVVGEAVGLPFTQARPLPALGAVDAVRFQPLEAGALEVALEAGAPTARGSALRIVRQEDGRVLGAGATSALAWVEPLDVVHATWTPGPGAPAEGEVTWTVRMHSPPGAPDPAEPSPSASPRPLVEDGPALDGVLAGLGAEGVDRDRYALLGRTGQGFRIIARPVGDSPARPALLLRDVAGELLWRSTPGPDGLTRLDGVFPAVERYELEVVDEGNTGAERTTGGDEYRYAIAWSSLNVPEIAAPPPTSVTVRLDAPGAAARVEVPATFDRWVAISASGHGGGIVPLLTVLDPGGGVLSRGLSRVAFRPAAFRGYSVVVTDALGRGGPGKAVEVITRSAQLVTFSENAEGDQPLAAGLATRALRGGLDSGADPPDTVDEYTVTAPVGAALIAHALAVPDADRVRPAPSIRVSILDSEGGSRLAQGAAGEATPPVPTEAGARYVVRVELQGPGRVDYAVVVDGVVCPSPAGVLPAGPGDVRFVEYLGDVGGADPNADGLPGATADRFLEWTGEGAGPVHVGGFALEGSSPPGVWLPCGMVVAPGRAAVLFGGGLPWGDFGGAAVWTLGRFGELPGADEPLVLKDPERAVVAQEEVGASVPGESRQWDGEAWSDHAASPGAQGGWSPGSRPNGDSYTLGALCSDDGGCSQIEVCGVQADLPAGEVRRACGPRLGAFAAGSACLEDGDCASGLCAPPSIGGEPVCRGACGDSEVCALGSRCYEDEWAFRFPGDDDDRATDDRWVALPACAPSRGSARACASFPDCDEGEVCVPVPRGDRLGWRTECRRAVGIAGHGALCEEPQDCQSGVCARIPGTDTSVCLGACVGDGDCEFGACRQVPMPTDDHDTPANPDDDRALPLTACFP